MSDIIENSNCLACGSNKLEKTLDLDMQPLANNFKKTKDEFEPRYPLGLNVCTDCFHLQLTHTVNPKIIYENYLYVSGTSKTLKSYSDWFAGFVDEIVERNSYNVLDIGCNDGTQLDSFKDIGYTTYGIDPAKNIYDTSSKKHNVVCDFFNEASVYKLEREYDAIVAQNVCAHNPNPYEFIKNCSKLMVDHTLLFIQTSQADMVLNNEFDTIYHEHVNFFNIHSMNMLVERVGMHLIDVIKTPIHGNSYVFIISKTQERPYYISNLMSMEGKLLNISTYRKWVDTVKSNMQILKETVNNYKDKGYRLVGYGAAAKGNTLLNFTDIKLDYIIDDSPYKQNLFTPGSNIPVVSIDILNNLSSDDKVLYIPLAWNFFSEIKFKILNHRTNKNDLFLKYFPKVEVHSV